MIASLIKLKLTKMVLSAVLVTALGVVGATLLILHIFPALWMPITVLCGIGLILSLISIRFNRIIGIVLTVINGVMMGYLLSPFLLA